jgi:DNA-binding beta-propeller fold protein YncE
VNTQTNTIFVVNASSSSISVFDGNTNTLTGAITTSGGAVAIAVNEKANQLYVANAIGTIDVFAIGVAPPPPTGAVVITQTP